MRCKVFKTRRNQKIKICDYGDHYTVEQILKHEVVPGRIFKSSFGDQLVFNRYGCKLYPFDEKTSREIKRFVFGGEEE